MNIFSRYCKQVYSFRLGILFSWHKAFTFLISTTSKQNNLWRTKSSFYFINPFTADDVYTCNAVGGPKLRMTRIHVMKESSWWIDGFHWKLVLRGYLGRWIWIRGQKSKFRDGWSNMATINFEKSNDLADLDENWY